MNLTALLLLLIVVTLLVGAGVAAALHRHPAWGVPATGALAATGLLIAVTRN